MDAYVIERGLIVRDDGSACLGLGQPSLAVSWPRHAIGSSGSDQLDWRAVTTGADDTEVEIELEALDLRASLRHTVTGDRWRVRATLRNAGLAPVSVSGASVDVSAGLGQAWVWGGGAAAAVVLAAGPDASRPWALSLRRGELTDEGGELRWLSSGETLAPGQRVVLELDGVACPDWGAAAWNALPSWLPTTALREGEGLELALPDAAVQAPECEVTEDEAVTTVSGTGRRRVVVSGSFGRVSLDADFAPSLTAAVRATSRQLARLVREVPGAVLQADGTGPDDRARALDRAARRLLVLQAAREHGAEQDIVRGWLLEGVTHLVVTGGVVGASTVAALAGEVQRRGDVQAQTALLEAVAHLDAAPGMGLVLTRAWVALWGAGVDVAPVRTALEAVLASPDDSDLARIERQLLQRDGTTEADLLGRWQGMLGAGLPGRGLPAVDPVGMARLVATSSLITDAGASGAANDVVTAAETVALRLLAGHGDDPDVLSWLVLAQRD